MPDHRGNRADHREAEPGLAPARVPPESIDGRDAAADGQGQSDAGVDDRTDHAKPGFGDRIVRGLAVILRRELAGKGLRYAIAVPATAVI